MYKKFAKKNVVPYCYRTTLAVCYTNQNIKCTTMNNKHFFYKIFTKAYFILLIPLIGCNNDNLVPVASIEESYEISEIDAQPIVELKDNELIRSELLEQYRHNITSQYGEALLENLQDQKHKLLSSNIYEPNIQLIKDLKLKQKATDQLSTHFKIINEDGSYEEFLMGIRAYVNNITQYQKTISTTQNDDVWIALNPDKFYLEDDDDGNEIWPVTFTANHITDESRSIEVVFDKNGLVSASEIGKFKQSSISNPNLMFLEPIVIEPCFPIMQKSVSDDCDGGGGGYNPTNPPSRVNDWSRGEFTGDGVGTNTYVVLKKMSLATTGDGDGAAELQMFVKKSDNDLHNFPVSYKYRFDRVWRSNPYTVYDDNTIIQGADKGGWTNTYYEVPDINHDGVDYSFDNITRYKTDVLFGHYTESVDYFPLFNLTQSQGPWRFALSDDDKDYADMSRRRIGSSYILMDVNTYDMDTETWQLTETGFTTRSHTYGSSDDPNLESGVRNITESNMQRLVNGNNEFSFEKWYGAEKHSYTFGLETYTLN